MITVRALPELHEKIKGIAREGLEFVQSLPPQPSMIHPGFADAVKEAAAKPSQDGNVKALLDDVERLTKEVDYWKARFEKAVNAYEGEQVSYWRAVAKKLEARVKEFENSI